MTKEINRDVVSIGIDFRPIPVDIGDGIVWQFNSDPSPSDMDSLFGALRKVGSAGKKMAAQEEDAKLELKGPLTELHKALGGLLIKADQKTEWAKKSYGLGSLNALSEALIENTTGFTGKSAKNSGKG